MDTRLLEIFVAAASTRNFRSAAQALGIAQPAVTQRIQQFEDMLGFALFHRINRGVELTTAGQSMLIEAQEILARTDLALRRAKLIRRGEIGEVRVGFGTSVMAETRLPNLLRDYMTSYPDIRVVLVPGTTMSDIVSGVETQETDVVFIRAPVMTLSSNLHLVRFSHSRLSIAVGRSHPLAKRQRLSLHDVAEEKLLLPVDDVGLGLSHSILSLYDDAGLIPNIGTRVSNITAILGLIAANAGISILPEEISHSFLGIKGIPLDVTDAYSDSAMIYRRGALALHVQHFLKMARDTKTIDGGP